MYSEKKLGLLIHGYHLQAIGWESIVWGTPSEGIFGTIPRGITEAYALNAAKIFWGTGASERDGVLESQYMYTFALTHVEELAQLCSTTPDVLREFISTRSVIDIKTQNTVEELQACLQVASQEGIEQLVIVAAATHASRSIKTALSVIQSNAAYAKFRHAIFLAPSDTSFFNTTVDDVMVVEPPHRGDQPAWQTFRYVGGLLSILKKGEETYTAFLADFGELLIRYGVVVNWKPRK